MEKSGAKAVLLNENLDPMSPTFFKCIFLFVYLS